MNNLVKNGRWVLLHNLILEVFVVQKVITVAGIAKCRLTSYRVKDRALPILLRKVHQSPEKSCRKNREVRTCLILFSLEAQ